MPDPAPLWPFVLGWSLIGVGAALLAFIAVFVLYLGWED